MGNNLIKSMTWLIFYLCTIVASSSAFLFNIQGWYTSSVGPSFAPPTWVFGPVWTMLYIFIAFAGFFIATGKNSKWKPTAIGLWSLQMVLNVIWTPIFFGTQNFGAALVYIVALWVSIFGVIISSWKVDKKASYLMIPYLGWVSFATLLNYSYWQLNLG